jgi:hypothetical protein
MFPDQRGMRWEDVVFPNSDQSYCVPPHPLPAPLFVERVVNEIIMWTDKKCIDIRPSRPFALNVQAGRQLWWLGVYHIVAGSMLCCTPVLCIISSRCRWSSDTIQYIYVFNYAFIVQYTMQTRSNLCIHRNKTTRPRSQFPNSCRCERFYILYSHKRSKIGGPIVGIYKSLTDTWMYELGTRPRGFISGNICFEFLVQYLCSAVCKCTCK